MHNTHFHKSSDRSRELIISLPVMGGLIHTRQRNQNQCNYGYEQWRHRPSGVYSAHWCRVEWTCLYQVLQGRMNCHRPSANWAQQWQRSRPVAGENSFPLQGQHVSTLAWDWVPPLAVQDAWSSGVFVNLNTAATSHNNKLCLYYCDVSKKAIVR